MPSPVVSIIIPTYNRSGRLRAAVESALAAMARPEEMEIIIVDDCSPDDTAAVCAALAQEFPQVRPLRRETNGGQGGARNSGIPAARGEFIAFLDDDDWRLPLSLDRQVARLREAPQAAFCYGPVRFAESHSGAYTGEVYPQTLPEGDIFWVLVERNLPQVASVVVRKQLLPPGDLFTPAERNVADWDAWLRLAHGHPVVAVPEPVAAYRLPDPTSDQISSNTANMALDGFRLQQRLLATLPRAAAEPARARAATEAFLDWTIPWIYERMRSAVASRNGTAARGCWRALYQLQPRFALRRRVLRALAASWVPGLAAR